MFNFLRNIVSPGHQPSASNSLIQQGERYWYGDSSTHGGIFSSDAPAAGIQVDANRALASAAAYACTKAIAENIASLPGCVYNLSGGRRTKDESSDAHYLLSVEPNLHMDPFSFWELGVTRLVNRGNMFCEIERDKADRPIALWPIHNSRVEPFRAKDKSLNYKVYVDTKQPEEDRGEFFILPERDMLNICGFGGNGIEAPGVVSYAREDISLDFAAQQFGAAFYAQGGKLAGVVEHPDFIHDEDQRRIFRNDMNAIHASRESWHKIGVLWEGAKYKEIQVRPSDAQFLESRKFQSNVICRFYGVPPSIIQDYADFKFATADAMLRAFVMTTLRPYVTRIERAVNKQVLQVRGRNSRLGSAFESNLIYELILDNLLRGDPETQAKTNKIRREAGVISTDEWRDQEGMNPIGGREGEMRIIPSGYQELGAEPEPAPAQQPTQEPEDQARMIREALAEALQQSSLIERPAQVTGSSQEDRVLDACVTIANDARDRMHAIAMSQFERWKEHPGEEKLAAFYEKQRDRLVDALMVVEKTLDGKPGLATALAHDIVAGYEVVETINPSDFEKVAQIDLRKIICGY